MLPEGVTKTPFRVVSEEEFFTVLAQTLEPMRGSVRSVTGPGRSGAVAAVYASHYLGVPFLPVIARRLPGDLLPLLVIDTAALTGKTLRRAEARARKTVGLGPGDERVIAVALWPDERRDGRVRFWYEAAAMARRSTPCQ